MIPDPHDPQRPDLKAVPEPDPVADVLATIAGQVERQVVDDLNPENVFIGQLLHSSAAEVCSVLRFVHDDDVAAFLPNALLPLIRGLAARGIDPDPMAVVACLRDPAKLADFGLEDVPQRHGRLARYLIDVYTGGVGGSLTSAARQVVEDSHRRGFGAYGTRIAQMAECFADIEDIEALTVDAVAAWRSSWSRLNVLSKHGSWNRGQDTTSAAES